MNLFFLHSIIHILHQDIGSKKESFSKLSKSLSLLRIYGLLKSKSSHKVDHIILGRLELGSEKLFEMMVDAEMMLSILFSCYYLGITCSCDALNFLYNLTVQCTKKCILREKPLST